MGRFSDTKLMIELEQRHQKDPGKYERTLILVKRLMPDLETLLRTAGTTPLDFSLHDDQHAFRVAERIPDLVTEQLFHKLSQYELALLLLSAYSHDLGMSPKRDWLTVLRNYLITGEYSLTNAEDARNSAALDLQEKSTFDDWLRLNSILQPGLAHSHSLTPDLLAEVDEAISYYCRDRHNDWSAALIMEFLPQESHLYAGWISDLVRLCQSHHWEYDRLIEESFDPKPIGSLGEFVHLRYLACLLRVADVMEFDPERTPPVLFRYRSIAPRSRIFWWKDQEINWFFGEQKRLTISARPQNATIHNAILSTASAVEQELRLCRKLEDRTDFGRYSASKKLPHHWVVSADIDIDVRPRSNSYVYIDGSFRPDTTKLLELLGGMALYGDEFVAVRELMQNSYDAVREQTAYQRLAHPQGANKDISDEINRTHFVRLNVEFDRGRAWLVCRDTGVGMNKHILQNFFLISGATRRPDLVSLERKCLEHGFLPFRAGRFGIGVLSYFLLADMVSIRTRRSNEAGDPDPVGWHFVTEGVGTFGELREDKDWTFGTEVRMRIRENLLSNGEDEFLKKLTNYFRHIIRRSPCITYYSSEIESKKETSIGPDWTDEEDEIKQVVFHRSGRYLEEEGFGRSLAYERKKRLLREYWSSLRLTQLFEKSTQAFCARAYLAWHELSAGKSIAFLDFDLDKEDVINQLFVSPMVLPVGILRTSFGGMWISNDADQTHVFGRKERTSGSMVPSIPIILELDFKGTDIAQISVSRNSLELTEQGKKSLEQLLDEARTLAKAQVASWKNSKLLFISKRIAELPIEDTVPYWLFTEKELDPLKARLRTVNCPFTFADTFQDLPNQFQKVDTKEKVDIVREISITYFHEQGTSGTELKPLPPTREPDRVLIRPSGGGPELVPVWDTLQKDSSEKLGSLFPPPWQQLLGASCPAMLGYALNSGSILSNWHESTMKEWTKADKYEQLKKLDTSEILKDPASATAWLLFGLMSLSVYSVEEVLRKNADFRVQLLSTLFPLKESHSIKLMWWASGAYERSKRLVVISRESILDVAPTEAIPSFLPEPSEEWRLEPL